MFRAARHSKHVEPLKNSGIINSITKLHLVGISTELSTMHRSMSIKVPCCTTSKRKHMFIQGDVRLCWSALRSTYTKSLVVSVQFYNWFC
jgi:hypothetical protein